MTWHIGPLFKKKYGREEFNKEGVGDNLGNHSATENINLGSKFISPDGTDKGISLNVDGSVDVGDYSLPTVDGLPGQVLSTNGAGQLTWVDVGSVPSDQTFLFQNGDPYTFQDQSDFNFN